MQVLPLALPPGEQLSVQQRCMSGVLLGGCACGVLLRSELEGPVLEKVLAYCQDTEWQVRQGAGAMQVWPGGQVQPGGRCGQNAGAWQVRPGCRCGRGAGA